MNNKGRIFGWIKARILQEQSMALLQRIYCENEVCTTFDTKWIQWQRESFEERESRRFPNEQSVGTGLFHISHDQN